MQVLEISFPITSYSIAPPENIIYINYTIYIKYKLFMYY
jgi:hypothetical protein